MKIKKEILINGEKAILTYNDNMFGKDANTLKIEGYTDAEILFPERNIKAVLLINGEEYYNDTKGDYECDFYFEVVDRNSSNSELYCSEAIHEVIKNESELIDLIASTSYFAEYEICPKGFIAGYCDEESSNNCEYSALNRCGLCGAECQDCMGEIFAYKEDKAYVCDCSRVLFEDRHVEVRELS